MSNDHPPEVIAATKRVAQILLEGCDRCDAPDLRLLEKAGLMKEGICHDSFGQDTLEVGDPMWTFTDAGTAFAKSLGFNL